MKHNDDTSLGLAEQSKYSPGKALAIVVCVPLAVFLFAPSHQPVLAIFFTTLLLWFTEAIPLPVTALLVPILIALSGLLPASEVFSPFGNDILYLFLGCFLMGLSMAKYGFDRRAAYWLLARSLPTDSLVSINLVIAGASFFLSMWISNTAATAIMCAVTIGILDSLREKVKDEQVIRAASVRLLLSCAYAASIGGLATPIGSPPNLIALKYLSSNGIDISFVEWMIFGLPLSLLMFAVLFVIFEWRYPIRGVRVEAARAYFAESLKNMGPMSRGEKQVAAVFLLTITFWIVPGILQMIFPEVAWIKTASARLSMSVVGVLGGLLVFILPVADEKLGARPNLDWTATCGVDWGTILLFGGGLSLGNLLEASGAAKEFGGFLFSSGTMSMPILIASIVISGILLSEFASNTASAAILIPLVVGTAKSMSASNAVLGSLVLCVAFSASFGFMLPVSTPPNAIVYGSGRVASREMLKTGMWFDITGALIIAGFAALMLSIAL